MGIHFNVEAEEAAGTARLLAQSGFSRARVEFGWDSMSYADPSRLENPGRLHAYLRPLRANGLRPLILLNANHGIPGPARFFDAVLTQPARAGDRHVQLDAATARAVVPHKTGLNSRGPAARGRRDLHLRGPERARNPLATPPPRPRRRAPCRGHPSLRARSARPGCATAGPTRASRRPCAAGSPTWAP